MRHLGLAVVAALIALGLGLALGAGPLVARSSAHRISREDRLASTTARLQQRVAALEDRARTDSRVVAALAAPLTDKRLAGHSVVILRTPGASDSLARSTRAALLGAGAALTGEIRITTTYDDPAKATAPLEDLALRLVPPGLTFTDGASSIERVGVVLARSLVAAKPTGSPDQAAAQVVAGFTELGAVRLDGTPGRLAELAVVVSGDREQATAEPALSALVAALDRQGAGVVVTGPGPLPPVVGWLRSGTSASGAGGAAGAAHPSSVDSADTPAGRVATVLALVQQLAHGAGTYGTGPGATSVLPTSVLTSSPAG